MMLDANNGMTIHSPKKDFWLHASLFPPPSRMTNDKIASGAMMAQGQCSCLVRHGGDVHFEAPAATRVDAEMGVFPNWFNENTDIDAVLKAGLAHLWFVTLHPLDDGNGRIARAIADMVLARSEQISQRFYSMSAQIREERDDYYDILERTQKGSMDVTLWMEWFLGCLDRAIEGAHKTLSVVLWKARFWESAATVSISTRQRLVLNRLLDGFDGKLTTSKWAKLAKCSQDTALRDILYLVEQGVLVRNREGGRSTTYDLKVRMEP